MGNAMLKDEPKDMKYLCFEGTVKKQSKQHGGSVVIEGFANRAKQDGVILVDRGNDFIPPEAWKIEEFKSLPIIFFNHDRDFPVGKATMIKTTEDGLFIRVKISDSMDPEITRIRDLVKEGILKAFSVGFDPLEMETQEIDGKEVNVIKSANLLETSIVSLPMAQASLFDLKTKDLAAMSMAKAIEVLGVHEDDDDEEEEEKDDHATQDHSDQPASDSEGQEQDETERETAKQDPMQECIAAKVPKFRDEGMEPAQAVAAAINFCQNEGKCSLEDAPITPEALQLAFELAEATPEKQGDEAVMVIESSDSTEPESTSQADTAKQTNVLLATLIREFQLLRDVLSKAPTSEPAEESVELGDAPADGEDNIKIEENPDEKNYITALNHEKGKTDKVKKQLNLLYQYRDSCARNLKQ